MNIKKLTKLLGKKYKKLRKFFENLLEDLQYF